MECHIMVIEASPQLQLCNSQATSSSRNVHCSPRGILIVHFIGSKIRDAGATVSSRKRGREHHGGKCGTEGKMEG